MFKKIDSITEQAWEKFEQIATAAAIIAAVAVIAITVIVTRGM